MTEDPFAVLGLRRGATPDAIRAARRELARVHHPDAGGDPVEMQRVNAAASDALAASPTTEPTSSGAGTEQRHDWAGTTRDIPSFNVDALPAQTFEALLLAAAELGEVEDDDPPYELHTLLAAPIACWCRLEVVPDAGASTVSIWIAPCADQPVPEMTAVRNAWITAINGLDWADL